MKSYKRVAVIGGGIQGVGIALELSMRGAFVDLYEKRSACLTQASLRNEGKIHLGFVYAKDSTFATARTMAAGAAHFEWMLRRWLERDVRSVAVSAPFYYYVHRDSLVTADELARYYSAVTAINTTNVTPQNASYFGADATAPVVRAMHHPPEWAEPSCVAAVFKTPEIAIDPEVIARLLSVRVMQDPRIRVHLDTAVTGLTHDANEATLDVEGPDGIASQRYDHVVNASWEDLLSLDSMAGVEPIGSWSFRSKYHVRIRASGLPNGICSATTVLGPFGDVVQYANGDIYLSWYPVGRRGISSDIKPPAWLMNLNGPEAVEVRRNIFDALCRLMPGLSFLAPSLLQGEVEGGIIFAWGHTDVHDPESRLHERYSVGPRSFGRYHTVNTGKYTLAPMFAKQTAERIMPAYHST